MNKEDLMLAFEEKAEELKMCLDQKWGDYENPYTNSDTSLAYDLFKSGAQAQIAQQSDDYGLVPKELSNDMCLPSLRWFRRTAKYVIWKNECLPSLRWFRRQKQLVVSV